MFCLLMSTIKLESRTEGGSTSKQKLLKGARIEDPIDFGEIARFYPEIVLCTFLCNKVIAIIQDQTGFFFVTIVRRQ